MIIQVKKLIHLTTKTSRRVKLQGKYRPTESGSGNKEVPWLTISGVWLEAAGFKAGQHVEINIERNQLIITNQPADGNL
jgi:hypothetical protein